jgi:hypothetical protein
MPLKLNPVTGALDLVNADQAAAPPNFSYVTVETGETIEVPEGQQMIVDGPIKVDGALMVSGSVSELVDYSQWSFSWNRIESNRTIRVPSSRDMIVMPGLKVDGTLAIDGRLIEIWD